MDTSRIKVGRRWYNPGNKQVYEVWCVANIGFDRIYERTPIVVLKCLTAKREGYYTIPASDFPGPLKDRMDGRVPTPGPGYDPHSDDPRSTK